jgi:ankyrin repeat protein
VKAFLRGTSALILLLSAGTTARAADDPAVVKAARAGDAKAVAVLIQQKADVNASAIDGTTALHWAVRADDLETTDALIRAGAQVTAASRHGVTPLYIAADQGNAAMIRRLVTAGADANGTDISGDTVLMAAARAGNADAVRALLDAGAKVDTAEPQVGHTALMWAVREDRPELVKILLAKGASLELKTRTGARPAARPPGAGGGSHGVGIVRGGVPPQGEQTPAPGGMTALSFAAREGRLDAARLLIDAGADVNAPEANGIGPLLMAISNRHTPVAALLLSRGANANAADWWGRTPLWSAVDVRNLDLDSRTLDNGVERAPMLELIEALIAKGADINVRVKEFPPQRRYMMPLGSLAWVDFTGQTPFVRASLSADVPLMKLLLAKGADPNIATFNGTTALMAAAGVNWVIGQTYSESPAMWIEAVKLCLELGAEVNAVNTMGLGAVHGAANRGSDDIIELLARHGARLDIKDKEGRTPITWAEGVFLATNSPVAKPSTIAVLRKLLAASSSVSGAR